MVIDEYPIDVGTKRYLIDRTFGGGPSIYDKNDLSQNPCQKIVKGITPDFLYEFINGGGVVILAHEDTTHLSRIAQKRLERYIEDLKPQITEGALRYLLQDQYPEFEKDIRDIVNHHLKTCINDITNGYISSETIIDRVMKDITPKIPEELVKPKCLSNDVKRVKRRTERLILTIREIAKAEMMKQTSETLIPMLADEEC